MAEILYKELSYQVVGAAMEVHRLLGGGFLEKVYQVSLAHELRLRQVPHEQYKVLPVYYKVLPVYYKDLLVGQYEADFVIADRIIVEINKWLPAIKLAEMCGQLVSNRP